MGKKLLLTAAHWAAALVGLRVILPASALSQLQINPLRMVIAIGLLWFAAGCTCLIWWGKQRKTALVLVTLTALLTWTYVCNPFDPGNVYYRDFQRDSDSLVFAAVEADLHDVTDDPYGLGFYSDILGQTKPDYPAYRAQEPISDEDGLVFRGYSTEFPGLVVHRNEYTQTFLIPGNLLSFANGEVYAIAAAGETELGWYVTVESGELLSADRHGEITELTLLNPEGETLPQGYFHPYRAQFGLQGKLAAMLPESWQIGAMFLLPLLCAGLFAGAVTAVGYLMMKKYSLKLAVWVMVVFWLSPWAVNFAKSVYWVSFTWMLPMVAGLALSLWGEDKRARLLCYGAGAMTILLKSLCGYEYLTFVMLGTILPLLVDMTVSLMAKDWKTLKTLFLRIFFMGLSALAGFLAAIVIHGTLRGEGDLLAGILRILQEDAIRRTVDIDLSFVDILLDYFAFQTHILPGVGGELFPLLAVTPLILLVWNKVCHDRIDWQDAALYLWSFLSAISWFVLAKNHSHVHPHLNYVCWYYWFIPVCFYLMGKQFHEYLTGRKGGEQ